MEEDEKRKKKKCNLVDSYTHVWLFYLRYYIVIAVQNLLTDIDFGVFFSTMSSILIPGSHLYEGV